MSDLNVRKCLAQLPVAAFALDQQGKIIAWNTEAESLFGRLATSVEGKKGWTVLGSGVKEAFFSGCDGECDLVVDEQTYALRFHLERDDEDVSLATFTASKKSSLQLDELRSMLTAVDKTQARIEFELDGTIIDANDNFLRTVGYTLSEIKGQHHRMFVDPAFANSPAYSEFWGRLNRGEYDQAEYKRLAKGGKEVWIQASYNPILDPQGKPIKVVKYATDVTQEKLRNADYQGQLAAVNKSQAVIEFNLDGTIITANDNFLSTVGYSLEEIRGRHHRMFVDPTFAASAEYAHFWEKLNRGEFEQAEYKRLGRGGKEVWIQASYNPILDLNGKPYKVVKYATDVTVVKRAVILVQRALGDVARGVIDIEITEAFDGDLNDMRDNVNNIARVLRRFNEVMAALTRAAQTGHLNERANPGEFEGAYADIVAGVNDTLDAILTPVANIRSRLAQMASGDLTAYVEEDYQGDHAALKNALNSTLDGLNDLLGQVSSASGQISSSSRQVAAAAQDLSQGASEQAATIEEISAQMAQITAQTTQNAENASQANQLAVTARDGAKNGDRRMNEMLGAMRDIEEASNNISKIIKVIDEIAFQTNLLALNAAVEAARAGVHGKGFAVVAEEVRNLAARSARAAKETTEMIEGSIKKVSFGTNIAQETAGALGAIVADVGKVTDLVAEIAAASNEQAEGINQVNSGLDQVNQVTQRNTATAEESAASAEEMSGQTSEMQTMITKFKLREAKRNHGLPENLSPEMLEMLQSYVERLMGKTHAASTEHHATSSLHHTAVHHTAAQRTPAQTGDLRINLDSRDFGKY